MFVCVCGGGGGGGQKSNYCVFVGEGVSGGLKRVCGRPTLALGSALVHQTKQLQRKHLNAKQVQIKKTNIKHLFYLFTYSLYFTIKHDREQDGHNASRPQTNR